MPTSADIATQMIQQLRVLDPAISAEPGTPERKIIDTVAIKVAESQLDLTSVQGGLSIDNKFGASLDKFLAIFNFGRQQAVAATGFVTFSRPNSPAPRDIRIPTGTRVIAPDARGDTVFRTSFDVVLRQGSTSIVAPVVAVIPGALGNVAANRITQLVNVEGIYAVTNELPTSNGLSVEDDDVLKARFKNTVFRNVSGTYDQFLALAVATPSTTKANVVGPISRYREYVQVPENSDAVGGNGDASEWTTALSTIPYSKYTYGTIPHFVSNAKLGADAVFFRPEADYHLNTDPTEKNRGDAYRQKVANPGEPEWDALDGSNDDRPSVTFLNVYTGTDAAVTAVRPADVLLFEHSYMSSASRNDWERNVTNCVDVFVDGDSTVIASAIVPRPTSANMFIDDPTHRLHFQNFTRMGEHQHYPVLGNLFTPLFFQPVTDIPDVLTVGGYNYYQGYHYWLIEDISELGGTVRARGGIEWDKYLPGQQAGGTDDAPQTWTGPTIVWGDDLDETGSAPSIDITGYAYDRNVNDLQATLDSAKQTTTDVLAHRAKKRFFKLDITVMYTPGANTAEANATIRAAVQDFLQGQYFGSAIQLSDLLNVIHNVGAVDNVRWSRDVPSVGGEIDTLRNRVVEANANGTTLTYPVIDTTVWGTASQVQRTRIYLPNAPTAGNWTIGYNGAPLVRPYNDSAAAFQTALRTLTGALTLTVTGSGTPTAPWLVTYGGSGVKPPFEVVGSTLSGGPTTFNTDFYLEDNELPALPDGLQVGDTVPGFIIRPRAQSTWVRL